MKTTIKTGDGEALTVEPMRLSKALVLTVQDRHGQLVNMVISPDQFGVLVAAGEREFEAMGVEL